MLVLTRKYQEKIRIGENITITVLRTKGKAVRLGIEAPTDVSVIRGELAFEPAAVVTEETEPVEAAATVSIASQRAAAPRTSTPAWPAESPQRSTARQKVAQSEPQVQLQRVPRGKVNEVLPKLISGAGPLRAMMPNK